MEIKDLNHPFQVGTKVLKVSHYTRCPRIDGVMTVSKAHKNGLVKLTSDNGYESNDNFRPNLSRSYEMDTRPSEEI
jgi:hypothetical protein